MFYQLRKIEIAGAEFDYIVFLLRHIECRHNTAYDVRTRVAIPQCSVFEVYWQYYECRFDILPVGQLAVRMDISRLPKYMPGVNRREKYWFSRQSTSALTVKPG